MSHLDEIFIIEKMLFSHDLAWKLARMTLKMGKIPIFTPLEGSEGVKSLKQKYQAPQNT